MTRTIQFTSKTQKFLASLDAKRYKQVVAKALSLTQNPMPNDAIQMKNLAFYRVDIGEYRIVYSFDETSVVVETIGKRNDDEVYKNL